MREINKTNGEPPNLTRRTTLQGESHGPGLPTRIAVVRV
jgi:hypothetical protein